jgi:hypothetical protein
MVPFVRNVTTAEISIRNFLINASQRLPMILVA